MSDHPIQGLMKTAMEQITEMVNVNTVVGDPVETPDGSVIMPISRVGFGFAAGGSEFGGDETEGFTGMDARTASVALPFGGGSGGGVSITPIAFLVVGNQGVKIVPLDNQTHIYERLIDLAPQVVEKIQSMLGGGSGSMMAGGTSGGMMGGGMMPSGGGGGMMGGAGGGMMPSGGGGGMMGGAGGGMMPSGGGGMMSGGTSGGGMMSGATGGGTMTGSTGSTGGTGSMTGTSGTQNAAPTGTSMTGGVGTQSSAGEQTTSSSVTADPNCDI